MMQTKEDAFLRSALVETGAHIRTKPLLKDLRRRQAGAACKVEPIPWSGLDQWKFDHDTGNLGHQSGKFFSIEGIRVTTSFGPVASWTQPIIVQPEIGILGFLAKRFNGVLHLLMQAKMEPGNIGMIQLAPTVQATRSNYTQVHQGSRPNYLDFFLDHRRAPVLIDQLQSEQGARFLRKRNRNMIVETAEDFDVLDGFYWLALSQINEMLKLDNMVNMDARSVLSCIPFVDPAAAEAEGGAGSGAIEGAYGVPLAPFKRDVVSSALCTRGALHNHDELISWFTELKTRYELEVERIPLKSVMGWAKDDWSISHKDKKYFSVIAVSVDAREREVPSWTQPMVQPQQEGVIGFVAKAINGVLHFLVQAKLEPGNHDVLELAPTVQCITGSYKTAKPEDRPVYLDTILNAPADHVRYSAFQSEEGGRFFREQNRNLVVEVGDDFPLAVPPNFAWMTLGQMNVFIKYNNYFNVEARSLIACMGMPEVEGR